MKLKLFASLFILIFILNGCTEIPTLPIEIPSQSVCGNGVSELGETSENCCIDVGCSGGSTCDNNICILLEKDNTIAGIPPLYTFACTSITAKVLEINDFRYDTIPTKVLVNSIHDYIPVESSETLLSEGDTIIVYLHLWGKELLYVEGDLKLGSMMEIKMRCLDGRFSSNDRNIFTKKDCYWSNVENINSSLVPCSKQINKRFNRTIGSDVLIPPDYDSAKGHMK